MVGEGLLGDFLGQQEVTRQSPQGRRNPFEGKALVFKIPVVGKELD
ncbi:hypothetical protein WL1483_3174 [Aeromonas schubertii]|uniref:Uncharacterized protein n=1 Tax=Aeromonas schubertii TaxID=652 RepID=A0A0S2SLH7_9GAMM|nr:hypothetical protein WL1483_3174 [Aeromonas schubertii]